MPSSPSSLTTEPAVPRAPSPCSSCCFCSRRSNFFDKLVFGLSAVPMMKELSLSPKEFGLIGSSFFLLFSLSGMAVGLFVVGRFPVKWILMLLAAIWSATQLPIFFSSSRRGAGRLPHHPRRGRGAGTADRAARLLQLVSRRQAQRPERGRAAGHQRRTSGRRPAADLCDHQSWLAHRLSGLRPARHRLDGRLESSSAARDPMPRRMPAQDCAGGRAERAGAHCCGATRR